MRLKEPIIYPHRNAGLTDLWTSLHRSPSRLQKPGEKEGDSNLKVFNKIRVNMASQIFLNPVYTLPSPPPPLEFIIISRSQTPAYNCYL